MTAPDRYAVIGHPVAHSRSPQIHQRFAADTGERLTYGRIDARPEGFEAAVRAFAEAGGRGLNVTVPHKEAAYGLAGEHGVEASEAQAVNTLSFLDGRIRGDNTDGVGLCLDLVTNLGVEIGGARVLIAGAGGATRGVLGPLLRMGPAAIVIANRTVARAEALAERFAGGGVSAAGYEALGGEPFDLVINATSAGLDNAAPPIPAACVGTRTFCYDMLYGHEPTPFARWAESAGASGIALGWGMLVEQAAESFRLWRGVRPDTAEVLRILSSGGSLG
jgi:shikimate dehydrogenase